MKYQASPLINQNKKLYSSIIKIKPLNFFIGFLLISTFFAFILGGIFIGKEKAEQKIRDEKTTVNEQIELSPVSLPGNPDNWIAYEFKPLNLEFKLPEELNKKGDWKVNEIPGDTGTQICFSDMDLGKDNSCKGDDLIIASTSDNFSTNEDLKFLNLQGFEIENGIYYVNTLDKRYELKNVRFKSFENNKNFKIIKILGKGNTIINANSEFDGTPDEGYLGAIINTENSSYPGIVLLMKIDGKVSEYEFDQILESVKKSE